MLVTRLSWITSTDGKRECAAFAEHEFGAWTTGSSWLNKLFFSNWSLSQLALSWLMKLWLEEKQPGLQQT
jgi:hypothetical protein